MLIDTHVHLDSPQLVNQIDGVLQRAREAGVGAVMTIGTDFASSRAAVELARRFPDQLRAAIGFQPNHCATVTERDWEELVDLARQPGVAAIGETGLDRYWKDCPFEVQQRWFDRHIRWSQQAGLPLVIHMRDCEGDIVAELLARRSEWPLRGIMHSFTGTWETAETCLAAGLHISFAGMVTYANAGELRAVARQVPLDRLLVETDSPYLPPEPTRKQRPNEPARVVHTAACIAAERRLSYEAFATATTSNAWALLGKWPAHESAAEHFSSR
jgi:TatD DNase family protein